MQMNWLALSLALVFIHSCRGYPWPADCRVERFRESGCWLTTTPDNIAAGNQTGGVVKINDVDCTVPHLKFNWMDTAAVGHTNCFQPLYRCTWNSTELEPQSIDYISPTVGNGRELTVEDTSINLTVGSECTFGGCYIDFFPIANMDPDEWYNVYWIEPVTCIINDNGCVKNPNACDSNADCSDIIGGFECTCRSGYTGNGTYCQDVDECSAGLHNCSDYANCYNTVGGFDCECPIGLIGDGFNCNNIDECSEGLDGCHQNAECIDTVGDYRCTCETGFVGDGYSCEIGPLIAILGIAFPALLLLAVCAGVLAICWMVIRNRQKTASLPYLMCVFPSKEYPNTQQQRQCNGVMDLDELSKSEHSLKFPTGPRGDDNAKTSGYIAA